MSKVDDITESIKVTLKEGSAVLKSESGKMLDILSGEFDKLSKELISYQRRIAEAKEEWRIIKKELDKLKETKNAMDNRNEEINEKIIQANKEAEEVAKLHRLLEKMRLSLDAREEAVKTKERRLKNV